MIGVWKKGAIGVNLLQLVYDFLFPLPPVCPICLKRQPRLQICQECRAEALQKRSVYGQCQRCQQLWCLQCPMPHLPGLARLSGRKYCPLAPISKIGSRSYWILNFAISPGWQRCWQKNWRRCCPDDYDVLVSVPLHPKRLRERGYNQSTLLARGLSAKSGIPFWDCLRRVRNTPHQTGLNRNQRLHNLDGAFTLKSGVQITGKKILLVDDVFTTGSTLRACAGVLHRYGAAQIKGICLAAGHD